MEELSEYERLRLEHINRNQEMLVRLGLFDEKQLSENKGDSSNENTSDSKKRKRVRIPRQPLKNLRRSARIQKLAPEYSGEEIDEEQLDTKRRKFVNNESEEDDSEDEEQVRQEILETTMTFLKEVRERVKKLGGEEGLVDTADGWKKEAIRRWGSRVCARKDWKLYVTSRLSSPPPVSPLDLLQGEICSLCLWPIYPLLFSDIEYFCADTWQLLCCVTLMSRVSSWNTKHRCISAFFERYPTPSAFLDEEDMGNVKPLIKSLGLFDDRIRSLAAITSAFLLPPEQDEFKVDLAENKIRGIGKFGLQSYLIFCKDAKVQPDDKILKSFCRWRDKERAKAVDDTDSSKS